MTAKFLSAVLSSLSSLSQERTENDGRECRGWPRTGELLGVLDQCDTFAQKNKRRKRRKRRKEKKRKRRKEN